MAGHSQFKNIMHRKGAQDAKRARQFNKIGREITVSARLGDPNPAMNPRLRSAIAEARTANMPRDRIERAIKAALPSGGDNKIYDAVRYEGYGPGGCAVIVEALTDNRNRTAADLRAAFSKNDGTLGESNSVLFQFRQVGEMVWSLQSANADTMMEAVIDAGGDDLNTTEDAHVVTCSVDNFGRVRTALEERLGEPIRARLTWYPLVSVSLNDTDMQTLAKLVDVLEDHDDVQEVVVNVGEETVENG